MSKGSSYYGPGGGYSFFSGKDGSRAFVTGQFDQEGLVENVDGLAAADYLGLQVCYGHCSGCGLYFKDNCFIYRYLISKAMEIF